PPQSQETTIGESAPRSDGRLSVEEENHLARRWRPLEDGRALPRLVEAHLGLVIPIAQEYRNAGPAMEDLTQEGNPGLVIAARRARRFARRAALHRRLAARERDPRRGSPDAGGDRRRRRGGGHAQGPPPPGAQDPRHARALDHQGAAHDAAAGDARRARQEV